MRRQSVTKGMRVRQAVETLFEGFKDSNRPESAWARRLMRRHEPTTDEIAVEISMAIERHCPALPGDYRSFIVDLLSAAIRLARQDASLDLERVANAERDCWSRVPHGPVFGMAPATELYLG